MQLTIHEPWALGVFSAEYSQYTVRWYTREGRGNQQFWWQPSDEDSRGTTTTMINNY